MTTYKAYYEGETLYYNGEKVQGRDPVGALCRQLKQGSLELYWRGQVGMYLDIARRASETLTEHPQHGLKRRPYEPLPKELNFN